MLNTQDYNQIQSRHTHSWTWVAISLLGAALIFSLVVALGVMLGLNRIRDEGPTQARFYLALQDHNYALAYTFLDSSAKIGDQAVNEQTFISRAAQADSQNRSISGFELVDNGGNGTAALKVHRGNSLYDAHLTMKQVDGRWLITSIDRL